MLIGADLTDNLVACLLYDSIYTLKRYKGSLTMHLLSNSLYTGPLEAQGAANDISLATASSGNTDDGKAHC